MKHSLDMKLRPLTPLVIVLALLVSVAINPAYATRDDKYAAFGRNATNALINGNGQAFSEAVDKDAILDSVLENMAADPETISGLRSGLATGLEQVGNMLIRNLQGSELKYLRSRVIDGRHSTLMRINFGDQGISYLDLILARDDQGNIKIIDWYDYSKGQYYTDSVRQAIGLMLPEERTIIERILGINSLNEKEANQFLKLGSLMREQKFDEWLEVYEDMPDKLKDSRILLLTRILVTVAAENESAYRTSLKALHDKMGDDPTLSLILIDYYYFEEDYESAQKALDDLSEHLGGDAAIDSLKANIYLSSGDYSQSMKYAKKSIDSDADYEDAYWTMLSSSVLSKEFGKAADMLDVLVNKFGYQIYPEDIEGDEAYQDFVESKQYKKWKKKRTQEGEE